MSVTRITALMIQGGSLKIETFKDKKSEKFGAVLWLLHGTVRHALLLSLEPEFEDRRTARSEMDRIVRIVKETDLSKAKV